MKATDVEARVARHGLRPLYLVVGEEDLLRDRAVAALRAAVLGGVQGGPGDGVATGLEAFNIDVLYGDECTASDILTRAEQAPVFAPHRMVIVKAAEKLPAKEGEALLTYLKEPCATTTLVFTATKLDKRLRFAKELLAHAVLVDCSPLAEAQLAEWIRAESERVGVRVSPEAVKALVQLALTRKDESGGSLNLVRRELEKLAAYVSQGGTAQVADVEAVRGSEPGASVFDLARAIGERRRAQALWILARNLDAGEEPLRILGALAWQWRQIWKAKEQRRGGGAGSELAALFTERDLTVALRFCAEMDAKLKGGGSSASKRVALETMVLALCARAESRQARLPPRAPRTPSSLG